MKTIIYYGGVCPKCGCEDVRDKGWYFECFKCGYTEKLSKLTRENIIKGSKLYKPFQPALKI